LTLDHLFHDDVLVKTHHELAIAQATNTAFLGLFVADDPQLSGVGSHQFCAKFITATLATKSAPDNHHVCKPATGTLYFRLFGLLTDRKVRLLHLKNRVLLLVWNHASVYLYLSRFGQDLIEFLFMLFTQALKVLIGYLRQGRFLIVHLLELLQVGGHILLSYAGSRAQRRRAYDTFADGASCDLGESDIFEVVEEAVKVSFLIGFDCAH
jgi:hypothetical protein